MPQAAPETRYLCSTFLLAPMKDSELRDLLEILELLADPTLADAICDRLVPNAHDIALQGPSMREKKGHKTIKPTATR
jgi:hypothetical protein